MRRATRIGALAGIALGAVVVAWILRPHDEAAAPPPEPASALARAPPVAAAPAPWLAGNAPAEATWQEFAHREHRRLVAEAVDGASRAWLRLLDLGVRANFGEALDDVDPVVRRLVVATAKRTAFADERALPYATWSDAKYHAAVEASRHAAGASGPFTELPPREPEDVEGWLRDEPIDAAAVAQRDGTLDRLRAAPQPPTDAQLAVALAEKRTEIEAERRVAARRYLVEVARLQPARLRRFAALRDARTPPREPPDTATFLAQIEVSNEALRRWCIQDGPGSLDDPALDALLELLPSRAWVYAQPTPARPRSSPREDDRSRDPAPK